RPAADAAVDLLRGRVLGPSCQRGKPTLLAFASHQRRLVRPMVGTLAASGPGQAARHRIGPAADAGSQYRRLGGNRRPRGPARDAGTEPRRPHRRGAARRAATDALVAAWRLAGL